VDDTPSEWIARAEEGLAEMQTALDHAKRHAHYRCAGACCAEASERHSGRSSEHSAS
jgi:hypothetical protein